MTPAPAIAIDNQCQAGQESGQAGQRSGQGSGLEERKAAGRPAAAVWCLPGEQVTNQGGQAHTLVTAMLESKLLPAFDV